MPDRLQLTAIADANGISLSLSLFLTAASLRCSFGVGNQRGDGGGGANRASSKLLSEAKTYRQIYAVVGGRFR